MDAGLELKAVQVTPVALERVVDRRMFRPTLGTRITCPRSEGAVEIDPARLGIEGHVDDLPGSRKAGRKGKQRQRVHDENRRRLAWRRVRAYRRREGHRVGLERATLRDRKSGATHTKRKRAHKSPFPLVEEGLGRGDFMASIATPHARTVAPVCPSQILDGRELVPQGPTRIRST